MALPLYVDGLGTNRAQTREWGTHRISTKVFQIEHLENSRNNAALMTRCDATPSYPMYFAESSATKPPHAFDSEVAIQSDTLKAR